MPMGESAVLVEVAEEISREANNYVLALMRKVEVKKLKGIVELVPAYTTLLVHYDPKIISFEEVCKAVEEAEKEVRVEGVERAIGEKRLIEVPVVYGKQFGPDLEYVAKYAGISCDEVIKIHSSQTYLVYMIGFTPGFTYMGEVPEIIAAPRLEKPRLRVPAGSVGIADKETGIYSVESPGGWRIIGRTPLKLFNPNKDPPTLLKAGDLVKFKPITEEEYEKLKEKVEEEKVLPAIKGKPALKVISAGLGVSIQDLGRIGFRKYGVPVSGALDRKALAIANILVGNDVDEACIELFQSTASFKAMDDLIIAITGAKIQVTVNNEKIPLMQAVPVRKGSEIVVERFIDGQVAYIAIAGGISENKVLGSKSHYLRANIGRRITGGTVIHVAENKFKSIINSCPARKIPAQLSKANYPGKVEVRVILGPHTQCFSRKSIMDFLNSEFEVTPHVDRMGYRLAGPKIRHVKGKGRLISCGTTIGAVQVPPDGNPIVLMADAQTTGGYPIIATVIQVDIGRLAQTKPGKTVNFKEISVEEAQKLLLKEMKEIVKLKEMVEEKSKEFEREFKHVTVKFGEKILDAWIRELIK